MKAIDIMTRDMVTIGPDATVAEVAKLLDEKDVSALPVLEDGALIGIVSEADLLHRIEIGTDKRRPWWLEAVTPSHSLAAEFVQSHGKIVSDVMTRNVVSVSEDTPLSDIATILERHRIKRVPVVKDGELIGIVSRSNLIQALASRAGVASAEVEADRQIRDTLMTRLAEQDWTDFGSRNIIVSDKTVHLWGLVGSPDERKALISLAEETPGVTKVSDEMISAY